MNIAFLKTNEKFDLNDWNNADHYTKLMYHWLPDIKNKTGKTYCFLNGYWPTTKEISTIPQDYDTYVLSFQFEYPDFEWIRNFCQHMSNSQILLIYPYRDCKYQIENLTIINYQGWPIILKWYQDEFGFVDIDFEKKFKKLSSLAHRLNQFRTYVSAYIYKNWNPDDYIMSWHNWLAKNQDLYLLEYTGNNKVDAVIDYIKDCFINIQLKPQGTFANNPLSNLDYNWSAYTDCLVNCSNESVGISDISENDQSYLLPGPYLTEKTFKCLLSRTALLPVGQYNTYGYLESLGFKFDYPWDKSFDAVPENFSRFEKFFLTLDQVQMLPFDEIKTAIKSSCDHNQEYIVSGDFLNYTNKQNECNIAQYYN
jgi:hypothetical protein